MFDIALSLFLIISAIFIAPNWGNIHALKFFQFGVIGNPGYNFAQLLFFQFGVLSLFLISLFSKPRRAFNDVWARVVIIILFLLVLLHPISVRMFGNIFLGILLYYLVTVYTEDYKRIMNSVVFVSILNTVFALLQAVGIFLIYAPTGRIDGLMCTSTHLGIYQTIALPICYAVNPWLTIFPIISIVLSKSVAAILILAGWVLWTLRKRIFMHGSLGFMAVVSILTAFVFILYPAVIQKIGIRLCIWLPVLQEIYQRPYIGHGFKAVQINTKVGLWENPSSLYIQLAYYGGLSLLVPLYAFIKEKFLCFDRTLVACFVIALVAGIEKSYFDFPRLATTVIILTAFMNITKGEKDVVEIHRRSVNP